MRSATCTGVADCILVFELRGKADSAAAKTKCIYLQLTSDSLIGLVGLTLFQRFTQTENASQPLRQSIRSFFSDFSISFTLSLN